MPALSHANMQRHLSSWSGGLFVQQCSMWIYFEICFNQRKGEILRPSYDPTAWAQIGQMTHKIVAK
jgi:hypothetical protein